MFSWTWYSQLVDVCLATLSLNNAWMLRKLSCPFFSALCCLCHSARCAIDIVTCCYFTHFVDQTTKCKPALPYRSHRSHLIGRDCACFSYRIVLPHVRVGTSGCTAFGVFSNSMSWTKGEYDKSNCYRSVSRLCGVGECRARKALEMFSAYWMSEQCGCNGRFSVSTLCSWLLSLLGPLRPELRGPDRCLLAWVAPPLLLLEPGLAAASGEFDVHLHQIELQGTSTLRRRFSLVLCCLGGQYFLVRFLLSSVLLLTCLRGFIGPDTARLTFYAVSR